MFIFNVFFWFIHWWCERFKKEKKEKKEKNERYKARARTRGVVVVVVMGVNGRLVGLCLHRLHLSDGGVRGDVKGVRAP